MRRIWITLSLMALLVAALAMPSSASASHLARADFKSVSKYCKALRAEMGTKAFKRAFGKPKRVRRAHRKCVARRGVIEKVSLRSQAPLPASECPPGTQPEAPQPVSAFATPVPCVAVPPALPPAQPAGDDDDDEDEAEESEDQDSDDDESDDDDRDDDSDSDD